MPATAATRDPFDERQVPRLDVRCPARIRIARRQYAGFIDNLSEAGAHFITVSPIRESGPVILHLPDLPPIKAEICWTKPTEGGIQFCRILDLSTLTAWVASRNGLSR